MSFSMVTESILCVSRIPEAVFMNLVLQTNTFSNRQPTKKNLTQTISDRKMRVSDAPKKTFLLAAGNIKRHIFIPKQRPQNQKLQFTRTNNKQILNETIFATNNHRWSIFFWGTQQKIDRRRIANPWQGYLIPTWGHLSLANVGRSWAAGASWRLEGCRWRRVDGWMGFVVGLGV